MNTDNSVHHTTIHQGDQSTAQVIGGDVTGGHVSAGSGGRRRAPLWALALATLCILAALALAIAAALDKVDWETVAVPLVIAFLAAVGSIARIAQG